MTTQQKKKNTNSPMTPNSIPITEPLNTREPRSPSKIPTSPLSFSPAPNLPTFLKIPGILIFCIVFGYLIGRLRLSFLFLLPIAHIAYYAFNRKVVEYRRSLETLAKEEQVKQHLGEFETVEWMNHIFKKFWEVSEQAVSSIIYNEVNNVLTKISKNQPFNLKLSEITLGTRPPVIERISFMQNSENKLVLECASNFIPVQASEEILAYFKKERTHWNTYIELQVRLANLLTIPILVRDFTFSGIFKIEIDLSQKIPFAKKFRFSFLEMPVVDFKLIPLKSVDMLDLPYIGGLLNSVIKGQIRNMVLEPNSIEIDLEELAKYSGKIVGVVYVFIHDLEIADQSTYWIDLDISGKKFGVSSKKAGRNPAFNQGFYAIVTDTTLCINVIMQSTETTPKSIHFGKIHLRNLNKQIYSENLYLSNENSRVFLNVTTQFYPISKNIQESAIIYLSLISIEDLQCIGDPINRLYSSYCIITLEHKDSFKNSRILKRYESKRIFTTKDPFYNESFKFFIRGFEEYVIKVEVMNEKDNTKMGSVVIACADVKDKEMVKYRISGVENGEMNLKFNINYISMSNDVENDNNVINASSVIDENDNNVIDTSNTIDNNISNENGTNAIDNNIIDENSINNKNDISNKLNIGDYIDHSQDIPKTNKIIKTPTVESMSLGIYNISPLKQAFVNFKTVLKISLKSINVSGNFFFVFETSRINVRMEPFTTDMDIQREVLVPIEKDDIIRVRLFRMVLTGDSIISEEILDLSSNEQPCIVVFGKIRVEFSIESTNITESSNIEDSQNLKIVQVRFGEFNRKGSFSIDYHSESFIQNVKLINNVSTFLIGKETLYCRLNENGKNISQAMVPKRNCLEDFDFGNGLTAHIQCKVQECSFKKINLCKCGELEIFIIKASKIKETNSETFVKVFLNKEKIYKTNKRPKGQEPIFNESFRINVQKNVDEIGFHIYSINSLTVDSLIHFVDISLFNITEGYSRHSLKLREGNEMGLSVLQVIFNYKAMRQ